MNVDEKIKLFVKRHNIRCQIGAGEIWPFFTDGHKAFAHEAYLAACLCYITGIEMSLRLPLLFEQGKDIRVAYERKLVPLMNNELLRKAEALGLPIDHLRYPDEDESIFRDNLTRDQPQDSVRIVKMRNNLCHGNLSILVNSDEPDSPKIVFEDIKIEAILLDQIVKNWGENYKYFD